MDQKVLKKVHDIELEILCVVAEFCEKNNIQYSLYCGTMLGAIRHKGFIPWDDDIDICMLRDDYNRFIKLWTASKNEEYIIQNKEAVGEFSQTFTKIRKNNTAFVQDGIDKNASFHLGIFIDILPLDRIPPNRLKKFVYKWNLMNYLLYTKEFVPSDGNYIIKIFSKFLLGISSKMRRIKMREKYRKKITKYNENTSYKLVSANSLDGLRHEMPARLPEEYIDLQFEDKMFKSYADYDGLLNAWYGNYMELPPEGDREWKHKPIYIDFEKNYDNSRCN